MHATSLSSVHLRDLDATYHQVMAVEYEGSHAVRSRRLAFVLADVELAVLKVSLDGVVDPISEVACQSYGLIMHLASQVFDCSRNWMQARFTAQESGAHLERPILTRREIPVVTTLLGSFQGRLTVVALQHAFPGHYLTASSAPPSTTDTAPFKLTRLPPSTLRTTPARLGGGAVNADSGSDDDDGDL